MCERLVLKLYRERSNDLFFCLIKFDPTNREATNESIRPPKYMIRENARESKLGEVTK